MPYIPQLGDVFISTISKNLVLASDIFSKNNKKKVIFIPSLNQVNAINTSYVFNDMSHLKKLIKTFKNNKLFLGRDHFGINSITSTNDINEKKKILKKNLDQDSANKIDYIHIDMFNNSDNNEIETTLRQVLKKNEKIIIELGVNKDGTNTTKKDLKKLLTFKEKYSKNIRFITYQTGTKLFNNSNKGITDLKKTQSMLLNSNDDKLFFKEHNADFKTKKHFKEFQKLNFCFNIGPEFAYYENLLLAKYARKIKENKHLNLLILENYKMRKWSRWCDKNMSINEKFYSSAHYMVKKNIYIDLIEKIKGIYPFQNILIDSHVKVLESKFIF